MGIIHSHEAAQGPLDSRQKMGAQHTPISKASVANCLGEQTKARCPPPEVRIGKIKLNDLANGDGITCCTTSCGSSVSGSSASPEVGSWRVALSSATSHKITITVGSDSASARAEGSTGNRSPRGFNPDTPFPSVEDKSKINPKPCRLPNKSPRVGAILAKLRGRTARCRSQPPSGVACKQSSESHGDEASPNSRCNKADALRAHILMAEDDHRRRRQSDIGVHSSAASAANIEQRPSTVPEGSLSDMCGSAASARNLQKAADRYSDWQMVLPAASANPNLRSGMVHAMPHVALLPDKQHLRKSGGCLAPPRTYRQGATGNSWIADEPPDGQWEIERGVWTRQGVHHNHLGVSDDPFKRITATRRLSTSQHGTQPHGVPERNPTSATPQPWVVPVAPLAGRMKKQQQMPLHAKQQVVPITNRGVAAATTIEIAKRRQATDERRRRQQQHLASSMTRQNVFALSNNSAKKPTRIATISPNLPKGEELPGPLTRFEGAVAAEKVSPETRPPGCRSDGSVAGAGVATVAARFHVCGPGSSRNGYCQKKVEPSNPTGAALHGAETVFSNSQCLPFYSHKEACASAKSADDSGRFNKDTADGFGERVRDVDRHTCPAPCQLKVNNHLGHDGQNGAKEHPQPERIDPMKIIHQTDRFQRLSANSHGQPSASRSQQRNAFVANPRTNMPAAKRRPR